MFARVGCVWNFCWALRVSRRKRKEVKQLICCSLALAIEREREEEEVCTVLLALVPHCHWRLTYPTLHLFLLLLAHHQISHLI